MDYSDPDESERNVYGDSARESLMEDGEISAEEDAFMAGYDQSERDEEDTSSDAYEQAFASKRKKRSRKESFDDDFDEY
jgi:hypothetical protein